MPTNKMKEENKCTNPDPSAMYSKDELDEIHWDCENCGKEVIEVVVDGKTVWKHGHFGRTVIIEESATPSKDLKHCLGCHTNPTRSPLTK